MAKFVLPFSTPFDPTQVSGFMTEYMCKEGFEFCANSGENFWKKGMGLMTAPQYIRLMQNADGTYVLEAWLKFAILPGVYVGEMGIEGFMAALPKSFLRTRVNTILAGLRATPLTAYTIPNQPVQTQPNPQAQNVQAQQYNNPNQNNQNR